MTGKIALIAGATGLTGHELLHILLLDNYYAQVIAISRKQLPIQHPKLKTIIVDFDNLSNYDLKADHVFCCLGTTMKKAGSKENFLKVDFQYVNALAKTTFENNAEKFLLISAVGSSKNSMFFYSRVKAMAEEAVSSVGFKTVFIFRPSLLLGNRQEKRVGETVGSKVFNALSFLLTGPFRKYKPINVKDLAKTMLMAAKSEHVGVHIVS